MLFVMQLVMVECQALYYYRELYCDTTNGEWGMNINFDQCYTFDITDQVSFGYDTGGVDGYVMGVWGEDGCTGIPMNIYTQPGCIPVDGRLVMSFALIKLTSVLEIIDLRVAAMIKNTVIIARNCLSNKY